MKVTLVFPRYKHQNFLEEPIGVLILAAVLRKKGFKTNFIDGTAEESIDATVAKLKKQKPDVLGLSVQTVFADEAIELAKKYKRVVPKGKVVFGGPHATILPNETIKESCVDFVIVGEGDDTFPDLLKNLNHPEKVKGIVFKKGKTVKFTAPRPPVKNLDSIPFSARDLLPIQYFETGNSTLITSRGCPFNCSFCQDTLRALFGPKFRQRSVGNVMREIAAIQKEFKQRKMKLKTLAFTDDGLTYVKPWLKDLCEQMVAKKINVGWSANTRADTMPNEKLMRLMKKAGCNEISVGVESGDDFIRNEIYGKQLPREKIVSAFKLLHKIGIKSTAYLMVGAPQESLETINHSLELFDEIKPDNSGVSITVPLPHTYLYNYCKKKNILRKANSWSDYDYYTHSGVKLKNFSRKQIKDVRSAFRYAVVARGIFQKKLGVETSFKKWFYFFYNPVVMPVFKEIGEGRTADVRRAIQNKLGIRLT